MSVETGKKFIESFAEIKNKKSVVFVIYINVADDVSFQEHCLQIWIILLGFRDTNDFVNLGICKHEIKFTCRDYCRFTLSDCQNAFSKVVQIIKCTCTVFIDNFRNISTNSSI